MRLRMDGRIWIRISRRPAHRCKCWGFGPAGMGKSPANASAWRAPTALTRPVQHSRLVRDARAVLRQPQPKERAAVVAAGSVIGPNVAAVIEQRLARKGQAKSQSIFLAGGYKRLEQSALQRRANARARILHAHHDVVAVHLASNRDGTARTHGLDRVLKEIREHAFHARSLHGAFQVVR